MNGFGNKLCLDVTVTSTMKYHNNGAPQDIPAADINRIGKQAEIAYQKKIAKYDDLCKINRLGFLPMMKILRYIYFICKTLKIIQTTKVIKLKINIKI